jgi:subtilisin family serine protease
MWHLNRSQFAVVAGVMGVLFSVPGFAEYNSVAAQPGNVFINTPTLVTFVADIAPNPKLVKTGVRLIQDVGGAQTVLGAMYDDGTHGDVLANDNKFSVTRTISQSSLGTLNFRASAAYTGTVQREQSATFTVNVVPPLNLTVTPGQTEIYVQQGQTASTAFTLSIQNQSGQTASLTASEGVNPASGLGLNSDYPAGGWSTNAASQTYLIQNTYTGTTIGDYTVALDSNVTVGGNSANVSTQILVHVLPSGGGSGDLNLSSTPSGLQAGTTTNVLFAAAFSGGSTAPSSVVLDEVNASGNLIQANVAALADNGSGGDVTAGDGIYSGNTSLTAGSAGAHRYFRATGQFSGGGSPIESSVYEVQVIPYVVGFQPGNPSSIVGDASGTGISAAVTSEQYYCDQVMVIFKPGTPFSAVDAAAASVNGTVAGSEPALNAYQFAIPCNGTSGVQAAVATLTANPNVESAAPNSLVPISEVVPNDTHWGLQYAPAKVRADEAWVIGRGGTSIAIVDTGVDYNHPDLAGKVTNGYDYVNGDADAMDDHSHGTHCAGIAAANGNNALGIAGIAWNSGILAVKVCTSGGGCPSSAIASGINYASTRARIISMSLGGPSVDALIQSAVANAVANGNLVIAAAGNNGNSVPQYPCSYAGVLCVGSTTKTDARSYFSTYGPQVDIAAPGGNNSSGDSIYSTIPVSMGSYGYKSGTSMATPLVSGVAGLVWSRFPSWTADQVQARLIATAQPLPGLQIGPRVDAFDALFNGNFEDGLNGWSVTGTGSAVAALGPITPTRDATMGMASTGPDSAVNQSELWQSFEVQSGVTSIPVKFSYAMITEEYPEWVGSIYNDNLYVLLEKPDGTTATLAVETVNSSSFTAISGIDFPGGDSTTGWTGWKNVNLSVPITAGPGTYRIRVRDEGDGIYDTNMVVDNIRFK